MQVVSERMIYDDKKGKEKGFFCTGDGKTASGDFCENNRRVNTPNGEK